MKSDEAVKKEFRMQQEMQKEHWLRHLIEDEQECRALITWLIEEGLTRPDGFEARLAHGQRMKSLGNDWYNRGDFRRALHCCLGAVHALDFSPNEQLQQSEEQRQQSASAMLPILSNLCMVFMKRGDLRNTIRTASTGLRCADKLPKDNAAPLRAKLLYRRALARGNPGAEMNLEASRDDLIAAARLVPADSEVRTSLDKCKQLLADEKRAKRKATSDGTAEKQTTSQVTTQHEVDSSAFAKPLNERKLSPAAECFAYVVGRSLGKVLQCCRLARAGVGRAKLHPAKLRLAVAALLGPVLAALVWLIFKSES
eukprot:TRINITY_DN2280_c0_g1_i1.p1 TRINITY_DN2280_c0_g1~~TRINITY_DN2280_c0_g1_i1.p1  ORF type:complete len:312 (+),score=60.99 TRINITY_DN2280_c0_g1_i1:135-1070(+)